MCRSKIDTQIVSSVRVYVERVHTFSSVLPAIQRACMACVRLLRVYRVRCEVWSSSQDGESSCVCLNICLAC